MSPRTLAPLLAALLLAPGVRAQDEDRDTDGDGVPDTVERFFCTLINEPDTDGDGLDDYAEIVLGAGDPTVPETLEEREARILEVVVAEDADGDGRCDCDDGECEVDFFGASIAEGSVFESASRPTCDPTAPVERVDTVTGSSLVCGQSRTLPPLCVLALLLLGRPRALRARA